MNNKHNDEKLWTNSCGSKIHKQESCEKLSSIDKASIDASALPIHEVEKAILQKISRNSVCIVIGETGCGKTTQIPQFILKSRLNSRGIIGVTQPRRVAAISIAERVSEEMKVALGAEVGYTVRFENVSSKDTQLKYMTDGILLREALIDKLLLKYSVIILDEAHERTVHTDILFGIIKNAQRNRSNSHPLKIIVMSATMNVDHFVNYFDNAPVLYLEGRQFPIKILYAKEKQSDYMFSSLVTIFQIHQDELPNLDILLFMTGEEEIESTVQAITEIAYNLPSDSIPIQVCPLYSAMQTSRQQLAFRATPPGSRKIIVSTNIAETSITIPGVKFVIDPGKVKEKVYCGSSKMEILQVKDISQAQSWQRAGRAGRQSAGIVYRLYTQEQYDTFSVISVPEILRSNVSSVILQLMALGISDIKKFDMLDSPSPENVEEALCELQMIEAIDDNEEITQLGQMMTAFPIPPVYAKVLISAGSIFDCLEETLSIVAILSGESIFIGSSFLSVNNCSSEMSEAHGKFASSYGDLIVYLNIFRAYKQAKEDRKWCSNNFLNHRNLKHAVEVRKQLKKICIENKLSFKSCGNDFTALRKCFAACFFMQCAEFHSEGHYRCISSAQKVHIHPSSVLFHSKPSHVIYIELIKTSKCYMRSVCVVDVDWLLNYAPKFFKRKRIS